MASQRRSVYLQHALLPKQFRILRLNPSQDSTESGSLHGSLIVRSLDEVELSFTTLSYMWGEAVSAHSAMMKVDDEDMPITNSLASALHHIRLRNSGVFLDIWIDAIFINQDDNAEKSTQGQMMKDIYQSCSQVIVWLPPPPETPQFATSSTEPAIDLGGFLSYLAGDHFHDMAGYYADKDTGRYGFRESDDFLAMWEGFQLLACSPWWTRAWTVQEIILPPRATFLHYDAIPCDYKAIEDADQGWWRQVISSRTCCDDAVQRFPRDKMRIFQTFLRKVHKLIARRSVSGRKLDGRDNLYVVVRSFSDRQCKMNQDKIYSLWSQARNECYDGYVLDYNQPMEMVFTEVFTRMLKEASTSFITKPWPDFRVLYGSGFGPTASLPGKPSWVQVFGHFDSSASMDAVMDRMTCSRLYRAVGWETGIMEVSGRELLLRGQKVDKIRFVTKAVQNASDKENLRTVLTEWYDMLRAHLTSPNMTKVHMAVARLTCADVYHARLPPWQRLMKAILFALRNALFVLWRKIDKELELQKMGDSEQWRRALSLDYPRGSGWQDLIRTGDLETVDGGYRDAVEAAMTGRAMFITGPLRLMGLCQPQACEGDEVWIVDGARVPFVLRPIEVRGSDTVQYHMVGDCFVHGCMDGEYAGPRQQRERITIV